MNHFRMVVVENVPTQISVCAHMSIYVIVVFLDGVIVFKENYYQMTLDNDLNQCIMNKLLINIFYHSNLVK